MYKQEYISSYGLMTANAWICKPVDYEDILHCFQFARSKGLKICPLGSGLSFSHVALLNQQIALDMTNLNDILRLDLENCTITVQAGTRITDILKLILPLNFTLVGLTGSLGNTIAGNISNDVNGKDSWKHGNFSANVIRMKIMFTSGEIKSIDRESDPDLFHAIVGGLGLIAVILEATLKLHVIPSLLVEKETVKCGNLEETIFQFEKLDSLKDELAYSWTDAYASEKNTGRGLFEKARFIESNQKINQEELKQMLTPKARIAGLKTEFFWKIIRNTYVSPLHQLAGYFKYHQPILNPKSTALFPSYQYPMVKYLPQWNLLFYPDGFREAQLLFPVSGFEKAYVELLGFCRKNKITPFICAIRRHKEQEGLLSFADNGYSLTLNYGLKGLSTERRNTIQKQLMELCLKHRGKVYLGKFPFLDHSDFRDMYAKSGQYLRIKKETDPDTLLWSDAASEFLFD